MRAGALRWGLLALAWSLAACVGPQEGPKPGPLGPQLGGPWGESSLPVRPGLDLHLGQVSLTAAYARPSDGARITRKGRAFFRVLLQGHRGEGHRPRGRHQGGQGLSIFPEEDVRLWHRGQACPWRRDLSVLGLGVEGDAQASSFPLGVGWVSLVFEVPPEARNLEAFLRLGGLGWQHLHLPFPGKPVSPWQGWLERCFGTGR